MDGGHVCYTVLVWYEKIFTITIQFKDTITIRTFKFMIKYKMYFK